MNYPSSANSAKNSQRIWFLALVPLLLLALTFFAIAKFRTTPTHAATVTRDVEIVMGPQVASYTLTWIEQGIHKSQCIGQDNQFFGADVTTTVTILPYSQSGCGGTMFAPIDFMAHTDISGYMVNVTAGIVVEQF
jgi:hypothetical protein